MDTKNQISTLWKRLTGALALHETIGHEEHLPKARMKQIGERMPDVQVLQAGRGDVPVADLSDSTAAQRVTVVDNSLRWSGNPDKAIKQDIRKAHQMNGVGKGFSIDPLLDKH